MIVLSLNSLTLPQMTNIWSDGYYHGSELKRKFRLWLSKVNKEKCLRLVNAYSKILWRLCDPVGLWIISLPIMMPV